MRSIGRLQDENQARRFGDFLYAQGIESQVEGPPSQNTAIGSPDPDPHGAWEIWVLDDASVEAAQQMLEEFARHPDDPRFVEASRTAGQKRKEDQQSRIGQRVRMIDGRTIFYAPPVPMGILTIILIVVSVAVTLLTDLGRKDRFVQPLSVTEYRSDSHYVRWDGTMPEIRHGQIWRLFTPMFLHFGFLHIFFNMLWLRDLGSLIEARKSPWMLLALVLVISGTSNLARYVVSGPTFGGMSGVVYGLFGYVWMQGRFNPASQLTLEPQTVTGMIVWFFVCVFGLVGPIANTVHGVGLVVGVAWGFLAARWAVARRRG
jgi:GlpG protein